MYDKIVFTMSENTGWKLLKLKESVKSRFIAMVVLSGNLIRSLIDFYANTQFGVCLL